MAFGTATVVTTVGKALIASRMYDSSSALEPKYIAMGTGATGADRTAVVADTGLTTQVENRTTGTGSSVTTTATGDTHQVVGTVTATAGRSVDEAGVFDASSSGTMYISATFGVITLGTNDSIAFTWKVKFA